jgi:hypothetical protein
MYVPKWIIKIIFVDSVTSSVYRKQVVSAQRWLSIGVSGLPYAESTHND